MIVLYASQHNNNNNTIQQSNTHQTTTHPHHSNYKPRRTDSNVKRPLFADQHDENHADDMAHNSSHKTNDTTPAINKKRRITIDADVGSHTPSLLSLNSLLQPITPSNQTIPTVHQLMTTTHNTSGSGRSHWNQYVVAYS